MILTRRLVVSALVVSSLTGCANVRGFGSDSSPPATPQFSTPPSPASLPARPTATAPPNPAAAATVLVVRQFGFQMTLSRQISDATYTIDHSYDGTHTSFGGSPFKVVGQVRLTTPAVSANPACANSATGPALPGQAPYFPATIMVLSAGAVGESLNLGTVRAAGNYLLALVSPQYQPLGCVAGGAAESLFAQAFNLAVAAAS